MAMRSVCLALAICTLSKATEPATQPADIGPRVAEVGLATDQQLRSLRRATDRALAWLAAQQQSDGSFRADNRGQPAITSLAVLAFLACGHSPDSSEHAEVLNRAVEYVLTCRRPDGLICRLAPEDHLIERGVSHTAAYNHAISGLMLSEMYGMTEPRLDAGLRGTIEQGINFTLAFQNNPPKRSPLDRGGWRYVRPWYPNDSDMSVTTWQLMFLRSARNAGFDVPAGPIDEATAFVQRCFQPDGRVFYGLIESSRRTTVTTVGAGVLSLSLAGYHQTDPARRAGDWLLSSRLPQRFGTHRFLYHAFYYVQALHQLGGRHWAEGWSPMCQTLLEHQKPDGSWAPDVGEQEWGPCLSTSLAVLSLSVPYHLLPIFQR